MGNNNIASYGKIRYIDPNNIVEDSMYNKVKGSYNIPHKPEDYSIAVDLIVNIPKRVGTATTLNQTHTFSLTTNEGKISFLGGTNGFMTDTPGSHTYIDILKKDINGTHENLGITNIQISYNSYFYPEVTINFTDVRGTALMMPHEESYRRQKINANGVIEEYDTTVENFFTAIFSFPCPEFKLQVKGFYGKMVEYSLVVEDFRSSFNSNTGNFDATIKFIGKMYGLYTDIPMTYLIMAPYCHYGNSNGVSKWAECDFRFDDGVKMPTLLELKENVFKAHHQLDTDYNYEQVQNYNNAQKRLQEISLIKNAYLGIGSFLKRKFGSDTTNAIFLGNALIEDLFLFKMIDNNCDYLYEGEGNELLNLTQKLYDLIIQYNENTNNSTHLPFLDALNERNAKIKGTDLYPYIKCVKRERNNTSVIDIYGTYTTSVNSDVIKKIPTHPSDSIEINSLKNITIHDGGYPNVFSSLQEYINTNTIGDTGIDFAILCGTNLYNTIKQIEADTKAEIEKLRQQIEDEYGGRLELLLGFKPSIRNIVKIVMAHLQTFMEIYSSFLNNVTGNNARNLGDYGLAYDNTDIPNISSDLSSVNLPPFPGIINITTNEETYPTGIISKTMEETRLIDSIFDGSFLMLEKNNRADKEIESMESTDIEFIPSCWTDYAILNNPYAYTFKNNNGTIDLDWIMSFFGIRCMTRFMIEDCDGSASDNFGKCEAYNFWRLNKALDSETIKKLKSSDFNQDNFIGFIRNRENNVYIVDNKPCYAFTGNITAEKTGTITSLVKETDSDSGTLTPTSYYVPVGIGLNNEGYNEYIQNATKDKVGITTFLNDDTYERRNSTDTDRYLDLPGYTGIQRFLHIPYDYIKIVEKDVLIDWNSKLMSTDISNIIDEAAKKNIIEAYLTPTQNLFYKNKVWFTTGETPSAQFYTNIEKGDLFDTSTNLRDVFNVDNEDDLILESVLNYDKAPIFMEDNLTPERFLCSIPFDFPEIMKKISNYLNSKISTVEEAENTRIISIPYSLQLFLGLCIKRIKADTFDGIVTRLNSERNSTLDDNGLFETDVEYNNDNFIHPIYTILSVFMVDKDTKLSTRHHYGILSGYKEFVKTGLDYLGLEQKYEEWSVDSNPGGFVYFKNKYCFSGSGHYDTLKEICSSNKVSSTEETYANIQKKFNEKFSSLTRSTSVKNATDFTDRYNSVKYIRKDKIAKIGFNKSFEAYSYLLDFYTKYSYLIVPYNLNMQKIDAPATSFVTAFQSFKNALMTLYGLDDTTATTATTKAPQVQYGELSSSLVTTESKLSMYRTLKNIQDKHFSNLHNDIEKYRVNTENSEYKRFHFIDTFYNDIGDDLIVNANQLVEVINSVINGYETGTGEGIIQSELSVYSFLANLCQKNNMMLMAMPVFNGALVGDEGAKNFADMFRPIPYDEIVNSDIMYGPSYVCFYPHQPSKHLDIPNGQYSNDGFSIGTSFNSEKVLVGDINNTANFLGPLTITDLNTTDSKYIIPAFAVEYGRMNQSIFKNINVNMDNPMVTEYSVAAQFGIAQGSQVDNRRVSYEGQNLYHIFSNHSFTCTVEMMGCAQVQPLMYFQLNNIPMFRGAYQIVNVEHNITPGNMTTTFKGVRISKNKIPMVKTGININSMFNALQNSSAYDRSRNKTQPPDFTGTLPEVSGHDAMEEVPTIEEKLYTHADFISLGSNFKAPKPDSHTSAEGAFNELNPELRRMVYAIGQKMKEMDYGIFITSMTRLNSSGSKSDHAKGENIGGRWVFSGNSRREKLRGKDGYGIEKKYSEMGCAVDMQGLNKKGMVDKTNVSVPLFHLIATQFTKNIRQLLWEVTSDSHLSSNCISNCVHLASYGPRGETGSDKTDIHVSHKVGKNWVAVIADNGSNIDNAPDNIPPLFIKTLYDMAVVGKLDSSISLPNFTKAGITIDKITKERLANWCTQKGITV